MEEKVYDVLSTDTDIVALVSNRIYPIEATQTTTFPVIVFETLAINDMETLQPSVYKPPSEYVIRINLYSKTFPQNMDLFDKCRNAMYAQNWNILKVGDYDYDKDLKVYGRYIDVKIVAV